MMSTWINSLAALIGGLALLTLTALTMYVIVAPWLAWMTNWQPKKSSKARPTLQQDLRFLGEFVWYAIGIVVLLYCIWQAVQHLS